MTKGEKNFIENYFASIVFFINKVTDEWGDKLKIINNDKEAFRSEYTALVLWLTIQRFANLFDDADQQTRLIDGIHNKYYSSLKETPENAALRKKLGIKHREVLQTSADKLNSRYRAYDKFLPLLEDEANLFNFCRQFAEHIDLHNQTNYKDDIKEVMMVVELVKAFFGTLNLFTKEYVKENYQI